MPRGLRRNLPTLALAASQSWLPFGNGGQKQEVLLSLGQSKRPPHARRAREALMRVHDSSTRAPTVAATAVAIMLAFAPAKAQASSSILPILYLYGTGRLGPHPLLTLDPEVYESPGFLLVVALELGSSLCVSSHLGTTKTKMDENMYPSGIWPRSGPQAQLFTGC